MLALLQHHPEAVQILSRHTLADDNKTTDFRSTAANEITVRLAIALSSPGNKLNIGMHTDNQPDTRLSGQLVWLLNEALVVARQLGESCQSLGSATAQAT